MKIQQEQRLTSVHQFERSVDFETQLKGSVGARNMGLEFVGAYNQQYEYLQERSQALERYMERLLRDYLDAYRRTGMAGVVKKILWPVHLPYVAFYSLLSYFYEAFTF